MVHALHDGEILEGGLGSILQCVMVPQSGRISGSAVQLMSKMLQVFTLSYAESGAIGPKAMVLFTNFSAHEQSDGSAEISFDDSDDGHEE
jgi:hypothetical protein